MFNDEFDGMGGSYIVDPKTGKRKLVERTEQPVFDEPAAQEEAKPATKEGK